MWSFLTSLKSTKFPKRESLTKNKVKTKQQINKKQLESCILFVLTIYLYITWVCKIFTKA